MKNLLIVCLLLVVIVVSWRLTRDEHVRTSTPAPVVHAKSAQHTIATASPPAPTTASRTVSIVSFKKDQLDECVDVTATVPKDEAAKLTKFEETLLGRVTKQQTVLSRKCVEQFADRTPQATCIFPKPKDGSDVVMEARYYNSATAFESDGYLKDCLSRGGDWQSSRKDPEAARERIRQHVGEIRKMVE
jgi:hypothetical protein